TAAAIDAGVSLQAWPWVGGKPITRPLPHIARHVVETEGSGFEAFHLAGAGSLPAHAPVWIFVAPRIAVLPFASAGCVFPLDFARKSGPLPGTVGAGLSV